MLAKVVLTCSDPLDVRRRQHQRPGVELVIDEQPTSVCAVWCCPVQRGRAQQEHCMNLMHGTLNFQTDAALLDVIQRLLHVCRGVLDPLAITEIEPAVIAPARPALLPRPFAG